MTFKELLDSVPFDDIAPIIPKMYPGMKGSIGLFKLHYDMLKSLTPKRDPDANAQTCTISMEEEDGRAYLDAYPMEGDLWEHSLTKDIIVSPGVKASLAEIATCCLWHTSFYGFTPKQSEDRYETIFLRDELAHYRYKVRKNAKAIAKGGGQIPSFKELEPLVKQEFEKRTDRFSADKENKAKAKAAFVRQAKACFYKRQAAISDFIISVTPSLGTGNSQLTVSRLCGLFNATSFYKSEYTSYTTKEMGMSGAKYLAELFEKYDMVDTYDRLVLEISSSVMHEELTADERELYHVMAQRATKGSCVFMGTDRTLGNQCRIRFAYYNSERPI